MEITLVSEVRTPFTRVRSVLVDEMFLCRAAFAKCFIAIMKNFNYMSKSCGISILENLIIKT